MLVEIFFGTKADRNVVVHGAPADQLHIVIEGCGKVSAISQVATVKAGDIFGEDALRHPTGNLEIIKQACGFINGGLGDPF